MRPSLPRFLPAAAALLNLTLLAAALPLSAATEPAAAPQRQAALIEGPVDFFHSYNMTVLFPVSRAALGAADTMQAGSDTLPVLTLDECLERAMGDNPDYQKNLENLRASQADLVSAWGNFMPTISTGYGLAQNNQSRAFLDQSGVLRLSGGISKSAYGNLNMNYTLFNRGYQFFELRNARYLRSQRLENRRNSELGLVALVRRAYFNTLRQQKLLEAAGIQAEQRRDQLQLAAARLAVGSVTRLDVLQAQKLVKDQELVILQTQNALKSARMELLRQMGGDLGEQFSLADEFQVHQVGFELERLLSEARTVHPQLQGIEFQIRQQESNLAMGRLSYLPVVSMRAGYNRSEDALTLRPDAGTGRQLSVSVGWDMFDAFARFRQNRQFEVAINNLHYDLESVRLQLEQTVRENYNNLHQLYQRTLTLSESRELARQSLEMEQERYRLGSASIIELRQAQFDYSDAEVQYINSIYDFHSALSTLSQAVGRDLTLEY